MKEHISPTEGDTSLTRILEASTEMVRVYSERIRDMSPLDAQRFIARDIDTLRANLMPVDTQIAIALTSAIERGIWADYHRHNKPRTVAAA